MIIILILLGFSAFYMNQMSTKTSAILKENYLSVVYAREMNEGLVNINQEITTAYLSGNMPDKELIKREVAAIDHSFQLEMNNITEPGEDKLVSVIENGLAEYRDSVLNYTNSGKQAITVLYLQKKMGFLSQQLVLLSQMNGKAFETKSDDAKASSANALTQMSILGSICFLIALSFIYSFASYFNDRFFQLYNGIREIVSSNYGQRLYFDNVDEFYEISQLFNQMAEKLSEDRNLVREPVHFIADSEKEQINDNIVELKDVLVRIKHLEIKAEDLISKIENKD